MKQQLKIIDGDGHVFEDGEGIAPIFPILPRGAACETVCFPLKATSSSRLPTDLLAPLASVLTVAFTTRDPKDGSSSWIR